MASESGQRSSTEGEPGGELVLESSAELVNERQISRTSRSEVLNEKASASGHSDLEAFRTFKGVSL